MIMIARLLRAVRNNCVPHKTNLWNISSAHISGIRVANHRSRAPSSEFSLDQQMIDRDRAAALHQEIEGGHGPHQREFEAHLIPEKSAHAPALEVRYHEEN